MKAAGPTSAMYVDQSSQTMVELMPFGGGIRIHAKGQNSVCYSWQQLPCRSFKPVRGVASSSTTSINRSFPDPIFVLARTSLYYFSQWDLALIIL